MSEPIKTSEEETTSPQVEKKTPSKRSRMSFIERAQKESEELVKNMGGSLELEGGRRTRSSTRGTPSRATITPPPIKKARNSPASPKTTPRARGRGRKLDTSATPEPAEQPTQEQDAEEKATDEASEELNVKRDVEPQSEEKIEDNTKSSNETNGPEQSEIEHVNNSEKANEAQQTESLTESKSEEIKAVEEQAVSSIEESKPSDEVDAAAPTVKSIPEESENIQENSVESKKDVKSDEQNESTNENTSEVVDPPMDVDDDDGTTAATECKANIAEEVSVTVTSESSLKIADNSSIENTEQVKETEPEIATSIVEISTVDTVKKDELSAQSVKQPSPEPMEVDSSSKSSDVVECTDVVDNKTEVHVDSNVTKDDTITIPEEDKCSASENVENEDVLQTEIVTQPEQKVEENCIAIESNSNSVEAISNDISTTLLPTPDEIKSINAAAVPIEDQTKIETKADNNVVAEPKLVSEVNAGGDSAITTS